VSLIPIFRREGKGRTKRSEFRPIFITKERGKKTKTDSSISEKEERKKMKSRGIEINNIRDKAGSNNCKQGKR